MAERLSPNHRQDGRYPVHGDDSGIESNAADHSLPPLVRSDMPSVGPNLPPINAPGSHPSIHHGLMSSNPIHSYPGRLDSALSSSGAAPQYHHGYYQSPHVPPSIPTMMPAPGAYMQPQMSSANVRAAARARRTQIRTKAHVPSACANCRKAHLSCDLERPCHRCRSTRKEVCPHMRRATATTVAIMNPCAVGKVSSPGSNSQLTSIAYRTHVLTWHTRNEGDLVYVTESRATT